MEQNVFALWTNLAALTPPKINHFRGSELVVGSSQDSDSRVFVFVSWICAAEGCLDILPARTAFNAVFHDWSVSPFKVHPPVSLPPPYANQPRGDSWLSTEHRCTTARGINATEPLLPLPRSCASLTCCHRQLRSPGWLCEQYRY